MLRTRVKEYGLEVRLEVGLELGLDSRVRVKGLD
jgi:hypothetical protein